MKTLKDVLPTEFMGGEYVNDKARKHADVQVTATHDPYNGGLRWPGSHKNVVIWYELANGKAVGWNENMSRGWSFPVITYKKDAR